MIAYFNMGKRRGPSKLIQLKGNGIWLPGLTEVGNLTSMMKDRFVLRYRQGAEPPKGPASGKASPKALDGPKHSYLHDHRAKDELLEYLDDLES